jgi:hypothetical protein
MFSVAQRQVVSRSLAIYQITPMLFVLPLRPAWSRGFKLLDDLQMTKSPVNHCFGSRHHSVERNLNCICTEIRDMSSLRKYWKGSRNMPT